jgi:hypothetical protein
MIVVVHVCLWQIVLQKAAMISGLPLGRSLQGVHIRLTPSIQDPQVLII